MKRASIHSWWQKVKYHPWIIVAVVVGIVFIVVLVLGYWLNWDWTGLGPYTPPPPQASNFQRGKTLWDWLNLLGVLAIPIVVGLGAVWFTAQQGKVSNRENTDNQREELLKNYIDKISVLLLHEHLRDEDDVRIIARAQTVTVLPRLDGKRKGSMLVFLSEARLIKQPDPTIAFGAFGIFGADLSEVDLSGIHKPDLSNISVTYAIVNKANFSGVYLRGSVFEGSYLCQSTFTKTDLRETTLALANLHKADLTEANLTDAVLIRADLTEARLVGADLTRANLTDAIVTTEQLEKAQSLKGATMPDGSIHP